MNERRRAYLRAGLRSRAAFWTLFLAVGASIVAAGALHDLRILAAGPVIAFLLILLAAHRSATQRAETEFFAELAPQLGLNYTLGGHYLAITPLLAAGDRQRFEHTMEGPLFGKLGGPPCLVGHYTFETRHEAGDEVTAWKPHPFTVCAIDIGMPLVRFRGLYLRPRLSGLGLEHDWMRAPKPEKVELESVRFNELYELRHATDQDELAVRELFSPSFVVSLVENPLRPGFECKGGTLVVFIRGHEQSSGKIQMLMDTARSLARRLAEQEKTHLPPAERPLVGRDGRRV